jgi:hypothetical protein
VGFKPGSSVPEADVMSTAPRAKTSSFLFYNVGPRHHAGRGAVDLAQAAAGGRGLREGARQRGGGATGVHFMNLRFGQNFSNKIFSDKIFLDKNFSDKTFRTIFSFKFGETTIKQHISIFHTIMDNTLSILR